MLIRVLEINLSWLMSCKTNTYLSDKNTLYSNHSSFDTCIFYLRLIFNYILNYYDRVNYFLNIFIMSITT